MAWDGMIGGWAQDRGKRVTGAEGQKWNSFNFLTDKCIQYP